MTNTFQRRRDDTTVAGGDNLVGCSPVELVNVLDVPKEEADLLRADAQLRLVDNVRQVVLAKRDTLALWETAFKLRPPQPPSPASHLHDHPQVSHVHPLRLYDLRDHAVQVRQRHDGGGAAWRPLAPPLALTWIGSALLKAHVRPARGPRSSGPRGRRGEGAQRARERRLTGAPAGRAQLCGKMIDRKTTS